MVTCRLSDRAGAVQARLDASSVPFALVVSDGGVLLGRVPASELEGNPAESVEVLMDPGPKTYRPHKTARGVAQELVERGLQWALVTSPDGELIGVVSRNSLEIAAEDGR